MKNFKFNAITAFLLVMKVRRQVLAQLQLELAQLRRDYLLLQQVQMQLRQV